MIIPHITKTNSRLLSSSPSNTHPPSPQRYSSDSEVNYQRQNEQEILTSDATNHATWNWGRLPEVTLYSIRPQEPKIDVYTRPETGTKIAQASLKSARSLYRTDYVETGMKSDQDEYKHKIINSGRS